MSNEADRLLEPVKSYQEYYLPKFKENTSELFSSLLQQSGVDVEENQKTSEKYRKLEADSSKLRKQRGTARTWKGICIFLCIISVVLCCYGISESNTLLSVLPIPCLIGLLIFILRYFNPKIKRLTEELSKSDAQANTALQEAQAQVAPLLALFDSTMTTDLIQKTLPSLTLDRRFDMRRYDYLHGKYGLPEEEDSQTSTLGLLSGEILGNPFLFQRNLQHRMGMQTYTGTLTIHWVTYSKDSNGKTVANHHTQVLHASVKKPKPFFTPTVSLIYGNDAAPDLSFSHSKTHAEQMSERKLNSFVKSRVGKIQKKAEKNLSFTEMGNEKFDAIFGALDRDNEVQFRLLFTPLAQKNLLDLMTTAAPFGDDFNFSKRKCLNTIVSDHAQSWNLDTDTKQYCSYDAEIIKNKFSEFNSSYFTNFYFDLAPLLSIPLYQQMKPKEYIYKTSYERNFPAREAELMANQLGNRSFAHPQSVTPAILKTDFLRKQGNSDLLSVTAFSYRTVHRTDFVPVLGGDGRMHSVPVHWLEYIPLTKQSEMTIQSLDLTEKDYRASSFANVPENHTFFRRLFATVGMSGSMTDANPNEVDCDNVDYGEVIEETLENAVENLDDLNDD